MWGRLAVVLVVAVTAPVRANEPPASGTTGSIAIGGGKLDIPCRGALDNPVGGCSSSGAAQLRLGLGGWLNERFAVGGLFDVTVGIADDGSENGPLFIGRFAALGQYWPASNAWFEASAGFMRYSRSRSAAGPAVELRVGGITNVSRTSGLTLSFAFVIGYVDGEVDRGPVPIGMLQLGYLWR